MNRYLVTVSLKTGELTTFYMNSECDEHPERPFDCKIKIMKLLGKAREVISILDVDDKIHIYPFDSVNYITID